MDLLSDPSVRSRLGLEELYRDHFRSDMGSWVQPHILCSKSHRPPRDDRVVGAGKRERANHTHFPWPVVGFPITHTYYICPMTICVLLYVFPHEIYKYNLNILTVHAFSTCIFYLLYENKFVSFYIHKFLSHCIYFQFLMYIKDSSFLVCA